MRHLKLFEALFQEGQSIKIYHGTYKEEDAKSIIQNGWDESRRYRASAEGAGMGVFFSPDDMLYGDWVIEFNVSTEDFKNWIVFDTNADDYSPGGKSPSEVIDLAQRINGRVETVEEQILRINGNEDLIPRVSYWFGEDIGRIKGWVTQWRFGRLSAHFRDTSIAKPVRYFKSERKS
jgi:hypothetical protein